MHFFVLADPLFQDGDPLVKDRRDQTQDNDGHYHLVHTEETRTHSDINEYPDGRRDTQWIVVWILLEKRAKIWT